MALKEEIVNKSIAIVDVDPPRHKRNLHYLLEAMEQLKDLGVYPLVTDNSGGVYRTDGIEFGCHLRKAGFDPIISTNCRDHGYEDIKVRIRRSSEYGFEDAIVVAGDKKNGTPYKMKTPELVGEMSEHFYTGATANPHAPDMERQIGLIRQRHEAGAEYLLTQPVFYTPDHMGRLEVFRNRLFREGIDMPIAVGVWITDPDSVGTELDGFSCPPEIRGRVIGNANINAGTNIATETLSALRNEGIKHFYIIPTKGKLSQNNRYENVAHILENIRS